MAATAPAAGTAPASGSAGGSSAVPSGLPLSASTNGNNVVANPPLLPGSSPQVVAAGPAAAVAPAGSPLVNSTEAAGEAKGGAEEAKSKPESQWWISFSLYFPQAAR